MRSHLGLAETLRSGLPQDEVSAGDRATRERFMRAMRQVAAPRAAATAAAVGPPPAGRPPARRRGRAGTYALAFAAAGWEVTVLDLPETLEIGAPPTARGRGRHRRRRRHRGDPAGPLGRRLHRQRRSTSCRPPRPRRWWPGRRDALAPGGLLAIQEVLGDLSPQGPSFGVMMLVSTAGGDAYPEGAYRAWMAAAGARWSGPSRSRRAGTTCCSGGGAVRVATADAGPSDRVPPFRFSARSRVDVAETDLGAVVYYARYPHHIDRGVLAYRRHLGVPLLGPPGHLFVVRSLAVDYHASARFDEELEVFVRVAEMGRSEPHRAGADRAGGGGRAAPRRGRPPRDRGARRVRRPALADPGGHARGDRRVRGDRAAT